MGLDIYLRTSAECRQNDAHEHEFDEIWRRRERGELSEAAAEAAWENITPYVPHGGVPSVCNPEHLFNRRYLRSSYNDGGFDRAVPDFLGTPDEGSLYWIFEPMGREWDGDEGTLTEADIPKLAQAKARALDVAERLRKSDPLRVAEVANAFVRPSMTAEQFLAWYRGQQTQRAGKRSPFGEDGGYSCREGEVFGFAKGLEVLAATVGVGVLGNASALIVYRPDPGTLDHYVASAEITAEFCDEAIALIRADGLAHISWSG